MLLPQPCCLLHGYHSFDVEGHGSDEPILPFFDYCCKSGRSGPTGLFGEAEVLFDDIKKLGNHFIPRDFIFRKRSIDLIFPHDGFVDFVEVKELPVGPSAVALLVIDRGRICFPMQSRGDDVLEVPIIILGSP